MAKVNGTWVQDLRVSSQDPVLPVCFEQTISEMTALYGRGGVLWAAALAERIAREHIHDLPVIGDGPTQLHTLRMGVESAALKMLAAIYRGAVDHQGVPREAEIQFQDFARRRIPIKDQWALIRRGHSELVKAMMQAATAVLPSADHAVQLALISDIAFEYMGDFNAEAGRIFEVEERYIADASRVARDTALEVLLAGPVEDPDQLFALSRDLSYDVPHRYHWAIHFSSTAPDISDEDLYRAAQTALQEIGARQTLLIPQGKAMLWGYGNSIDRFPQSFSWQPPAGMHLAIGNPGSGQNGFRTSHHEASEAHRMSDTAGLQESSAITHFRDVNFLALVFKDAPRAQKFIADELGALASQAPQSKELRETLNAYLLTHNVKATSEALFVARNTVTYRLRKIESLLGRSVSERQLETLAALRLLAQLRSP